MVCGLKQCSGSNISRKQHELKLIFKLGTLRPNGLDINCNFLWLWVKRVLHIRTLKQWFSYFAAHLCILCTSGTRVRACVRTCTVFCMAWLNHSTYWRNAKPETFRSPSNTWHFYRPFDLLSNLSAVSRILWVFCSFPLNMMKNVLFEQLHTYIQHFVQQVKNV